MTGSPAHDYFQKRADEEREAAKQATDERAATSHRELADHYTRLADSESDQQADQDEPLATSVLPREFRILP